MERNPYAPPVAVVADQVRVPEDDELASRLQRFLNYIIDAIAQFLLAVGIGIVSQLGNSTWMFSLTGMSTIVFNFVLGCTYYLFCEGVFGRTVGKLVTRTRVVTVSGENPRFLQIVGRTLARFIPFEAFSFFGPLAVGWHDSLSGTRVIRTSSN